MKRSAITLAIVTLIFIATFIIITNVSRGGELPYLGDEDEIQRTIENDRFSGVGFPIHGPGGGSYAIHTGDSPTRGGRYAMFLEYFSDEGLEFGLERVKNMSLTRPIVIYPESDTEYGLSELTRLSKENPYEVVMIKSADFKE